MAVTSDIFKFSDAGVTAAKGFKVAAGHSGIRKSNKDDLMLLVSETEASVAAVLTTNKVSAWCVQHNKQRLKSGKAVALVCSAGNANCCNGQSGKQADIEIADSFATNLNQQGYVKSSVLTASTGVIGRKLDKQKILNFIPYLVGQLGSDNKRAESAIMTTDLVPKSYALEVRTAEGSFFVGGMSKGSGMIAPNMATMLGFITTDIEIDTKDLQAELSAAVDRSFNCITVDGDTSTNDMCLMLANGQSKLKYQNHKQLFSTALRQVCTELAKMIARDGEGATKLVSVKVKGAESFDAARLIAKTIAESPLVKTACFGNDPNWGRILAAAGRSGADFDPNKVVVYLAGTEIFRQGEPTEYDPDIVSKKMKDKDLELVFEILGEGKESIEYWTCDFSYDYVRINADYGT